MKLVAADRIVVRAPNWLGDVILSLPALRDLRRAYRRGRPHAAGRPRWQAPRPRPRAQPPRPVGRDLAAAVTWLSGQGVRFTPGGVRRGAAGHDVCFINPKGDATSPQGGESVLIELVQTPAEVIAAFDGLA